MERGVTGRAPNQPALERQPDEVRARLAGVLGSAAGLVQRIEFLPAAAEAPKAADTKPEPPSPPRPAGPPPPPPPPRPQRIVVDLSELEKLKATEPILGELSAEQLASVSTLVLRQIEMGLRTAERSMARAGQARAGASAGQETAATGLS